jgi:hypothetical protein
MAFNTGNPVPSSASEDLSDNSENLDSAVNAQLDTWVDRLAVTRDTVTGRLKKMGYAVPVDYASSIVFGVNDNVKTVDEGGIVYAPLPSALPFTTSGTFVGDDDARFFVIQGVTNDQLIDDLSISYDPWKTISEMQSDTTVLPVGKKVAWQGYYVESDGGSNWGVVKSGAHTDDGGSIFTLADGKYVEANLKGKKINVRKFGANVTGTDSVLNFEVAINYIKLLPDPRSRTPLYVPQGSYVLSDKISPHWGGMVGDGVESTELDFSTHTGSGCVEWGDGVSFNFKGELSKFKVKGNLSIADQAALKLVLLGTSSSVSKITCNPCNVGIYLERIFYTSFTDMNLFGQFNDGQNGDVLVGSGIYCLRPVNNIVFTNVSVQYFGIAFNCYDQVAETETSNNILFNNCSFERCSNVFFKLRRTTIKLDTCYTEHTRYNRLPANTDLVHMVLGELGSVIVFDTCRLSMTGYEISGDYAFDGDCLVSIENTKIAANSVIASIKPSSAAQIKYEGYKNTDFGSAFDFFDASYQAENQNMGGSQFRSAYVLQSGGNIKTLPLFQTDGGGQTLEVVELNMFDPFAQTGVTFDLTVTRRNQGNVGRTMKYLVTGSREPTGGVLSVYVNSYGGDGSDYFTGLLFPAVDDDMFDLSVVDNGTSLTYTLDLKPFVSGSGDATEANSIVSGRVEYLTLSGSVSEQRTNMSIIIDNLV